MRRLQDAHSGRTDGRTCHTPGAEAEGEARIANVERRRANSGSSKGKAENTPATSPFDLRSLSLAMFAPRSKTKGANGKEAAAKAAAQAANRPWVEK